MKQAGQKLQQGTQLPKAQQAQKKAAQELAKAAQKMKNMKNPKLSPEQQKELQKLAEAQKKTMEKTKQLVQQLNKDKRKNATQSLQQAKGKMQQAGNQMRQQDTDQARKRQEEAKKYLNKTKNELDKKKREYENQRREMVLYNLLENLRTMLKQQREVRAGTEKLEQSVSSRRGRLARSDRFLRRELVEKQRATAELARKAAKIMKKEDSRVFGRMMTVAATEMDEIIDLLNKNQFGIYTQSIEETVEGRLQQILDALKVEKRERDKKKGKQQQQGKKPKSGKQGKQRIIPRLAELKVIRNTQLQIQRQTEALRNRFEKILKNKDFTPEYKKAAAEQLRRFIRRTSHKQGNLAELLDEFIKSLEGKK